MDSRMSPAYRHCLCRSSASLAGGKRACRRPSKVRCRGVWAHKLQAICLLTLALLIVGCGSSGETRQDFAARANAICAGALRQTRSIPPPQAGGLAPYLDQLVPVVQSEVAQVRALRPPEQSARERATLRSFDIALAQVASDYSQLAAAARRGDADGVASAEATLRASPVGSLAASSGLSSCASAGSTTP